MGAASHHHGAAGRGMGLLSQAMFCMIPVMGLLAVLWLLMGQGLTFAPSPGIPFLYSQSWVPSMKVDMDFRVDGLSALMLMLITGVGSAVFIYAGGYMAGHPQQGRLYILLTLFFGAMIGCVSADNLILLFVFWELTSLTSFMLVGFNHETLQSRKSAQQALIVTGTGGLALLAGFLILGREFGTYSIQEILPRIAETGPTPALTTALVLILIGCFTKSAQFPFHFWLPNAMAAPTPVSAYLHSATMVKLGVYLLARLDPAFGEWTIWTFTLQGIGSLTAAWAMVLALGERDLKRILAWSTVATLGTLIMLIGVPGLKAPPAVASLLLAHALYKAPLFFVAGNIDHGTGTRIIDRLANLKGKMPLTAAAAALAGVSMAGLPLTFGFVAKEAIYSAKSAEGVLALVPVANALFSAIAVAVAAVAAVRVFWPHPGRTETCDAHEGSVGMVFPPLALALIGIGLGVYPQVAEPLILSAGLAMVPTGSVVQASLDLHFISTLSSLLMTLGIGTLVFFFWDPLHRLFDRFAAWLHKHGMAAQYENFLQLIPVVASRVTRFIQNGRLPSYMTVMIGGTTAVLGVLLWMGRASFKFPGLELPSFGAALGCSLVVLGSILACLMRERFVLLLASGLVGFGSAVLFLFTGAPDLAFTQFSVETLFVVVMSAVLLNLYRSRRRMSVNEPIWRPGAAIVASVFGLVMTVLLLAVLGQPLNMDVPRYFAENSLPKAHGRNVVNVIIVDFRGLDTLGEITVVLLSLLAALPVMASLQRRRAPKATTTKGAGA